MFLKKFGLYITDFPLSYFIQRENMQFFYIEFAASYQLVIMTLRKWRKERLLMKIDFESHVSIKTQI